MIRSLWTGAAGMIGHQTYLDVMSNNVGNINTIGFRKSAPHFSDVLFDTEREAVGSQGTMGGSGPIQVGHGSLVRAVDVQQTQGSVVDTGDPANMAINGVGYFIMQDGDRTFYTRAGNFDVDAQGHLVLPGTSALLQGVPASGGVTPTSSSGLEAVKVPVVPSAGETPSEGYVLPAKATSLVRFRCNLDSRLAAGETHEAVSTVYDASGNEHKLAISWTKQLDPTTGDPVPNAWHWTATLDDAGTPSGEGDIAFSSEGQIVADGSEKPTVNLSFSSGSSSTVTLDFGGNGSAMEGVTQFASPSTTRAVAQDGYAEGTYESFVVREDGTLLGVYSNEQQVPLWRISLATFRNPMGLSAEGGTEFSASLNSGDVQTSFPGEDGVGKVRGGSIEMSNVDLAEAFTDVIVAQRSYQANSRVVTTSDRFVQVSIEMRR